MQDFISFLENHFTGIFILLLLILCLLLFFNWIAWIFGVGRYKNVKSVPKSGFFFIFADMMVKIITDFRHFLALVLVLIFAIALGYAFSIANGNVKDLSDALQAVVSTLGGLVGSIVGYYFGESAAKSNSSGTSGTNTGTATNTPPVQGGGGGSSTSSGSSQESIREVKLPDNIQQIEEEE